MPRNYEDSRLVYVTIAEFTNLKYTFKTRVKTTTSTDLGHTTVGVAQISTAQGYVIGANSPKPPRASKSTETGIEGSFVDKDKIASAKAAGYSIQRGKRRTPRKTKFTVVKYVDINGIKYAWNSPTAQGAPSLDALGATDATDNDQVVFGADFPKPPRVKIGIGDNNSYSSFVDPNKFDDAIAAGWAPAGNGRYKAADLKELA